MERTVTVEREAGLHARPAAEFVKAANEFDCKITIERADDGDPVDAGSAIAVTGLGIERRDRVRLSADGEDAAEALEELEAFLSTTENST